MGLSIVLYVRHPEPWMREITKMWINVVRQTARVPIELIITECNAPSELAGMCDSYVNFAPPAGLAAELNAGLDLATQEFTVLVGNDVIMPPGWDTALLEPHKRFADCGISTLACRDLNHEPIDKIGEGFWGPLMCWRTDRNWRLDGETYDKLFFDTDLCMRIYEQGFRSYRNYAVVASHINQFTQQKLFTKAELEAQVCADKQRFIQKHTGPGGHLWVFGAFVNGWVW